ncbi:MAG: RNHCP domain-containing protein [Fimbriimonadaceae bacterium]|nr:RNHCP domain-containing protein [Fimbriimonadaceae bacterium]QYK57836.1 MAG: RNHCP domain-containing protein [Fimbriimonadaceae bacterium]
MKKPHRRAEQAHQEARRHRKKAARWRAQLAKLTGEPVPIGPLMERASTGDAGSFECVHCGAWVDPPGPQAGTENRNHCPKCLHSLHLDVEPGDRTAECGSEMEPVAVWVRRNGEWALIHRCLVCGALSSNRVAADDDRFALLSLAARPIALPPFPIDRSQEP